MEATQVYMEDEETNKMQYTHTMGCYSVLKMLRILGLVEWLKHTVPA
jgi:hypothetical protein